MTIEKQLIYDDNAFAIRNKNALIQECDDSSGTKDCSEPIVYRNVKRL